jgi:hypothetical protein
MVRAHGDLLLKEMVPYAWERSAGEACCRSGERGCMRGRRQLFSAAPASGIPVDSVESKTGGAHASAGRALETQVRGREGRDTDAEAWPSCACWCSAPSWWEVNCPGEQPPEQGQLLTKERIQQPQERQKAEGFDPGLIDEVKHPQTEAALCPQQGNTAYPSQTRSRRRPASGCIASTRQGRDAVERATCRWAFPLGLRPRGTVLFGSQSVGKLPCV